MSAVSQRTAYVCSNASTRIDSNSDDSITDLSIIDSASLIGLFPFVGVIFGAGLDP